MPQALRIFENCRYYSFGSLFEENVYYHAILKRQWGNQYGFGDQPNSDDFILKNMTDDMLDYADATNTKPIENFFGNWDREIAKTGPQGFQKAADNLIIKYARDNIAHNHQWRTKANREKAKLLKAREVEFSKTPVSKS